jgi:hypothetical protein
MPVPHVEALLITPALMIDSASLVGLGSKPAFKLHMCNHTQASDPPPLQLWLTIKSNIQAPAHQRLIPSRRQLAALAGMKNNDLSG